MAGLHTVDWIVLVAYLIATVGIGACFYGGQKSKKDFFLAGRSMSWFPVGLSVVATLFSAISYMAIPSSIQQYGLILVIGAFTVFACVPIVNRVFMPFYSQMGLYSAYEYLERRFDVRVRCLASAIFILWRVVWMSVAVYAPSLALWAATGGKVPLVPTIIVLGFLATLYTALGGMKAVIWTDVIQFCVLFAGMVLAAILVTAEVEGGIAGMFGKMQAAGKTALVSNIPEMESATGWLAKLSAYLCVQDQVTLLGTLVAGFVAYVGFYTVDQVAVQRYLSTKSLRDARRSFWVNAVANTAIYFCLAFLGVGLFAYYAARPVPERIGDLKFGPRLVADEVLDWPAFCSQLRAEGAATAPTVGRRIWQLLPVDARSAVQQATDGSALDATRRQEIADALNEILKRRDFYREGDFREVAVPLHARKLLTADPKQGETAERKIHEGNRLVLEASYPRDIATHLNFKNDWKYPYFVAVALPVGVAGLIIAALCAATMSSIDSGINSCTTAFMVDFWLRLRYGQVQVPEGAREASEEGNDLFMARVLTFGIGTMVTVIACFVGALGSIIEIAGKLINAFCGPMFAIFLLGIITRRARPLGVCLGALISLLVMWYYTFFAPIKLNFQWPGTVGLLLALLLGYGLSLLEGPPSPEKLTWTLAERRKLWK